MKIKKLFLKLMTISAMLALTLIMACACTAGNSGESGNAPVPTVTLSATDKTLDLNETFTLKATLENVSGTVTWTSSDPAVASVDQNGLVKAKSEGNTTITATVQEASATCAIIVENGHNLPYTMFTAENVETVEPNQEFTVQASTMLNGNPVEGLTYQWNTDVEGVVELTPSADTASVVIKGVKFGTVNVSCVTVCYGVPLFPSFTVTVYNPNVTFEVEDAVEGENGYPVNLTLFDGAQYDNEYTLSAVTVKDGEQVVDNSQIQWFVDDESVASFENGVIKAKKIGQTKILALYNNNGVYFDVNVVKAEFTVNDFTYIEVAEDNGFVRGDNIKGEVESVFYNKYDLFKGESDGKIHLDEKAVETIGLGKVIDPIVVYTDQATYFYQNVEFIAMLIDNKEEFDRMDEVGLMLGDGDTSTPTLGGIFYLNADIAYDGIYTPNEMNVANDSLGGFVGTFDGRGHVISGLKIVDGGYIFASIKSSATFKNVTFLNSAYDGTTMQSGTGAFLSKIVDGALENVFIHLSKVTLKNCNAMLLAQVNHGSAKAYQNVIVVIDQVVKAEGATRNPVLQTFGSRSWSVGFNNTIGIAPKVSGVDITMLSTCENDGKGNAINWKTYSNDYTALTDMNEDFESNNWDKTFWHEINGVVLPKTVTLGATTQTYEMGNNTDGINAWKSYKQTVEGVNKSSYKSDYTFNPNLVINLSEYGFHNVLSATIGGVEYASDYQNGSISILKSSIAQRGNATIIVVGTKEVDGEMKTFTLFQPLLLADILISTADDFEAMQWLADPYKEDTNTWCAPIKSTEMGGYIALTNNIAYNRTYKVHQNSAAFTAAAGFSGVLDGCGYVVDGLEMVEQTNATNSYPTNFGGFTSATAWGAGSGIFATMNGGTIKNIAFTNAKQSCGGGFITSHMKNGNTLENIYVHLTSAQGNDISSVAANNKQFAVSGLFNTRSHGGPVTIRNVFAKIDAVGADYYSMGCFYENTIGSGMKNVFIVSASSKVFISQAGVEATNHAAGGLTLYANMSAVANDKAAWQAGLTSSVWNTNGNLPVFANA